MMYNVANVFTLIACLLLAQNTFAQAEEIPPDVFEARPDSYLYADYPGIFDNLRGVGHNGITVEAWIYLTDRPKAGDYTWDNDPGGQWVIFAKPGSYYVILSGKDLGKGGLKRLPEDTAFLRFSLSPQPHPDRLEATGGILSAILPEDYPFSRWVHVGVQIMEERNNVRTINFYNRIYDSGGGVIDDLMGRTPAPFVIGGTPIVKFKEGSQWGDKFESMKGYIDAVRVSKGFRYDVKKVGQEIRPPRHFRPDAQTIALWRFEEGPGAPFYRDSSRNGYTLFPGGSLAVHPRGKTSTTWGNIKRGARF